MSDRFKDSDALSEEDFLRHPVWREKSPEPDQRGWRVAPVVRLPVVSLAGCWVGVRCQLANGESKLLACRFASEKNPRITQHFLMLTAFTQKGQVHLRPYHAPDRATDEAEKVAAALGRAPADVYPIRYDMTEVCSGERTALRGLVWDRPEERLSEDELMELSISDPD